MAVVNCRVCGRRTPVEDLKAIDFRCECGKIIPPEERIVYPACVGKKFSTSSWEMIDWYRAITWVFGAIVCIALGIWLIASPLFRTDPNTLTISDAMPGVGAIVAGCVLLAIVVIGMYRR